MAARWVTFDCFGTLVDWHTGFTAVLRDVAGERLPDLLKAYHQHERFAELERPHRLYRDVLETAVRRAAGALDLPITDEQATALPRRWGSLPIFPDVEPELAALRAAGFRLAVLTNCDNDLFAETQKHFRQPFDLVVTAEDAKDYKPAPTHFRRFFRVSGVELDDWVHVACSFYHDIGPAKQMGVRRVWVDRDRTGEDPAWATARCRTPAAWRRPCSALPAPGPSSGPRSPPERAYRPPMSTDSTEASRLPGAAPGITTSPPPWAATIRATTLARGRGRLRPTGRPSRPGDRAFRSAGVALGPEPATADAGVEPVGLLVGQRRPVGPGTGLRVVHAYRHLRLGLRVEPAHHVHLPAVRRGQGPCGGTAGPPSAAWPPASPQ